MKDISKSNSASPSQSQGGEDNKISLEFLKLIDDENIKIRKIEKKLKKFRKSLKKREFRYTEIMGIFIALFTFISVNIQIFSKIDSLHNAVFFVILMFFCLVGFVFFLHVILNNQCSIPKFCILICILLGILIFFSIPNFTNWIKPVSLENPTTINELERKIENLEQKLNIIDKNNKK